MQFSWKVAYFLTVVFSVYKQNFTANNLKTRAAMHANISAFLFVLERSYVCYYIACMTVPIRLSLGISLGSLIISKKGIITLNQLKICGLTMTIPYPEQHGESVWKSKMYRGEFSTCLEWLFSSKKRGEKFI